MRKPRQFFVYIMTNRPRSHVLYAGITNDLVRRAWEHKNKVNPGFTSRYNLTRLVYFEKFFIPTQQSLAKRKLKDGAEARRSN